TVRPKAQTCVQGAIMTLLPRFFRDQGGSVAPLLALTTLPLIGFVGAAVDYSNASSVRTSMQAALDSTALTLPKTANMMSQGQLQQSATAIFTANFNRPEAQNPQVTVSYAVQPNGSAVKVIGSAAIPTKFMGAIGFPVINISSTASVNWSNSRL